MPPMNYRYVEIFVRSLISRNCSRVSWSVIHGTRPGKVVPAPGPGAGRTRGRGVAVRDPPRAGRSTAPAADPFARSPPCAGMPEDQPQARRSSRAGTAQRDDVPALHGVMCWRIRAAGGLWRGAAIAERGDFGMAARVPLTREEPVLWQGFRSHRPRREARAHSSAVEHSPYKRGVTGSKPVAPTRP
jgi:hypothetical protein